MFGTMLHTHITMHPATDAECAQAARVAAALTGVDVPTVSTQAETGPTLVLKRRAADWAVEVTIFVHQSSPATWARFMGEVVGDDGLHDDGALGDLGAGEALR